MIVLLLNIIFIFVVIVIYKLRILSFWCAYMSLRKLPTMPGYLPIIGHGWTFFKHKNDLFPIFEEMCRYMVDNSQNVAVMWIGLIPFVVIVDPNDALKICNECMDKSYLYEFPSSWLGQGLVTAKYSTWRMHRKLISPSFNSAILNDFLSVFNEAAYKVLDQIVSLEGFFDPMPLLARYNMDVLCQTVLGLSPNSIKVDGFEDDVKMLLNLFLLRFSTIPYHLNIFYRFSKLSKTERKITTRLKQFSQNIIDQKNRRIDLNINESSEHRHKFKAFLDLLLALCDQGLMSEQEVREELDTMIVAGYDTSYSAMAFILPVLGEHQDVQQKVYEELESIFGNSIRDVDKDDLSKMEYLDAVIQEVLRIHPITPLIARKVTKPVKLQNYTIEEGCDAMIFASGINRHQCWGEDRYKFNPDRWFDNKVRRNGYASFGIGRRDCIGKTYSFMSMKTLLAHLIKSYKITKEEGEIITEYHVLSKPKAGHKIKLEKRCK